MTSVETKQKVWYDSYHSKLGADRNSIHSNKGVLFQTLALEKSMVNAFYRISADLESLIVLDVGCETGSDIVNMLKLGIAPNNITAIDVQREPLEKAKEKFPTVNVLCVDASQMPFSRSSFDLVFESTMFVTLTDDSLCARIADEMLRVCRPGGYLLLLDWRVDKPWDKSYKALTRKRLNKLFGIGKSADVVAVAHGALIPPVGRFLSAYLPSAYFLAAAAMPFLVGQVAYLLRKRGENV